MSDEPLLQISVSGLPPSAQHAYRIVRLKTKGGGTYQTLGMTKAGRAYKDKIAVLAFKHAKDRTHRGYVRVNVMFVLRWTTMNHKTGMAEVRTWDTSNHVKLLEDAVASVLGYDDSLCIDLRLQKRPLKPGEKEHHHIHVFKTRMDESFPSPAGLFTGRERTL